jgi:predicted nucleic acid-binding protein
MPLILADTTVLNNFAQVRRPDLLREAFAELSAPAAVVEELREGERRGLVPVCDWSWLDVMKPTDAEQTHALELEGNAGVGEAACLAILVSRGGLLLTDDGPARYLATTLGVELSGTIGALVKLCRQEILSLSEGDALLQEMITCGYRSPIRSLREIL